MVNKCKVKRINVITMILMNIKFNTVAAKTSEHAPSRVTSTRIIQEAQVIPESPEDPALKEVLCCIQFKDANTVLLNQQSSEQCSDAMVSQY